MLTTSFARGDGDVKGRSAVQVITTEGRKVGPIGVLVAWTRSLGGNLCTAVMFADYDNDGV